MAIASKKREKEQEKAEALASESETDSSVMQDKKVKLKKKKCEASESESESEQTVLRKPCSSEKSRNPTVQHEASRRQFLARSGLRGAGNSKSFPYANAKGKAEAAKCPNRIGRPLTQTESKYTRTANAHEAEKLAIAFCRRAFKKRGIPVPAKFQP